MDKDIVLSQKNMDRKMLKRLLKYTKPFLKLIILAIIILFTLSLIDIARPYIVKVVIDDHLVGYQMPMREVLNETEDSFKIGEKFYERDDDGDYKILRQADKKYYLVSTDVDDINEAEEKILLKDTEISKIHDRDYNSVRNLGLLYLFLILFTLVLNYARQIILNITSQSIIKELREDLYEKILGQSVAYFDKNPIGRLVTRIANDTETLNEFYNEVIVNLLMDAFLIVVTLYTMMALVLKLSFVAIVSISIILFASFIFRKYIRKIYRLSRKQLAEINASLSEYISNMRIITIFNKEEKIAKKFDIKNAQYRKTEDRQITAFAIYRPFIEFVRSSTLAVIIYLGGKIVLDGELSFGTVYLFIEYVKKLYFPIMDMANQYNLIQSAFASSERIFRILDEDYSLKEIENPVCKEIEGKIEFQNVDFSYVPGQKIFNNLSFKIAPGEKIAIVGETGAGKSTIINLISRMYDIDSGKILIDDIDIKDYQKECLRKQIGLVHQDVFIFSGNLANNISLDKNATVDEKMIQAADYVNASHFIDRLPDKYNTELQERGASLSSGERQLLSFARTLYHDPKVLILDEATSGIDTETERLIQEAIEKLTEDSTAIMVAHRLSTIQNADRIIVLGNGAILEEGNHEELLKKRGEYYKLYELQFQE